MEIKTLSQAERELKRVDRQIGLLIEEDRRLRERISHMTGATSTTFWLASGSGGSITAGAGLSGGGPLPGALALSVNVGDGIEIASDAVAVDLAAVSGLSFTGGDLQIADSVAGAGLIIAAKVLAVGAGTGIAVNANDVALSHLSIESLTDPGADRIYFWDDGAGASGWLVANTGLTISGTNLNCTITDTNLTNEEVQDIVGAMVTGNTETLIAVTYQDGDGTLDFVVDEANIDHDALTNFVANEHIDHTGVSITAGAGLSGGGTIAATRTIDVSTGTGIAVVADDVTLSHLGIEDLTDPGADRIIFWDDGASATAWLAMGSGPSISVTTLNVDHDACSNFVANEHIDHTSVSITAGLGLTGGGTIAATRTIDVGAGAGITVNVDDVALTVPGTLTVSTGNSAAGSHTHAITSSSNPGVAAAILASTASGLLRLVGLGVGATAPVNGLAVTNNVSGKIALFYRLDASPTDVGVQIYLDDLSDTGYAALEVRRDVAGELIDCQLAGGSVVTLQYANSRGEVIVADGGYVGATGVGILFDDTSDEIEFMDGAAVLARLWDDSGTITLRLDPDNAYTEEKLIIGSGAISVTSTGDDHMKIYLTGGGCLLLDPDPSVLIGDSSVMSKSSFMARGLVIDQDTSGVHILELDSTTDVAHGCTTLANTQTYGAARKIYDTEGGLSWEGYSESQYAIRLTGRYSVSATGKATGSAGAIALSAQEISGAGITNCTANQNVVVIRAQRGGANETVWIVDEDGDTYRDGTENTFDEWDDVQLVRAFDRTMSPGQIIDSRFDRYVNYHRKELLESGILTDPDGMFYNESKLIRLHNGAIWQLWQNFAACAQALADLGIPMMEYLPNPDLLERTL